MSKRAIRRHHSRRMKRKARRFAVRNASGWASAEAIEAKVKSYVKSADYLAACSCESCCNVRRSAYRQHQGKTRQELRNEPWLID